MKQLKNLWPIFVIGLSLYVLHQFANASEEGEEKKDFRLRSVVKVASQKCPLSSKRYRGSGFLFEKEDSIYIVTNDHAVLNSQAPEYCHRAWSPYLGSVPLDVTLEAFDWFYDLAILKFKDQQSVKRHLAKSGSLTSLSLENILDSEFLDHEAVDISGYSYAAAFQGPKNGDVWVFPFLYQNAQLVGTDDQPAIPAYPVLYRIADAFGEFGMSGAPVFRASTKKIIGMLSHRYVFSHGNSVPVVKDYVFPGASGTEKSEDEKKDEVLHAPVPDKDVTLLAIPSPQILKWINKVFESEFKQVPQAFLDPEAALESNTAKHKVVVSYGRNFEWKEKVLAPSEEPAPGTGTSGGTTGGGDNGGGIGGPSLPESCQGWIRISAARELSTSAENDKIFKKIDSWSHREEINRLLDRDRQYCLAVGFFVNNNVDLQALGTGLEPICFQSIEEFFVKLNREGLSAIGQILSSNGSQVEVKDDTAFTRLKELGVSLSKDVTGIRALLVSASGEVKGNGEKVVDPKILNSIEEFLKQVSGLAGLLSSDTLEWMAVSENHVDQLFDQARNVGFFSMESIKVQAEMNSQVGPLLVHLKEVRQGLALLRVN